MACSPVRPQVVEAATSSSCHDIYDHYCTSYVSDISAIAMQLQAHPILLNPITAADKTAAAPYLDGSASQSAPSDITRRFVLTTTQPLLEANGVLRWVSTS